MEAYFRRVYEETRTDVWGYIRARVRSPEDAADLTQETYLAFVRTLKTHGVGWVKNPAAFLTDLAGKKLADFYRSRKEPPLSLDEASEEDEPSLSDVLPSAYSLEDAVLTRQTAAEALAVISKKDDVTRRIFDLYFVADWPLEQIAENLGVKTGFVKNRLYRTLRELRKIYGKET